MRTVTASRKPFNEENHRALLEKINPAVGVETLIGLLHRERITLFEVHADGLLLGIFLARVDTLWNGEKELVIMHASAVIKPPFPMTSVLNPLFDQVARDHGLKAIRVHSDKKGLDRIMEENGYIYQEAVYRKALNVIQ
jgi:hypothetical protein